jgi:hypothetical protein
MLALQCLGIRYCLYVVLTFHVTTRPHNIILVPFIFTNDLRNPAPYTASANILNCIGAF